jgi:hypothetical protein
MTVEVPDDAPALEPITILSESTEPMAIPAIELTATPQEQIQIAPLTIEPLSATND